MSYLNRLAVVLGQIVLLAASVVTLAQATGVPVGGKWMMYQAEDPMTAAKQVRFELAADNFLEEGERRPKITIFCTNGELSLSDFRPNVKMAPPNRPGFWGQPQLEVRIRADDDHYNKGWNWVNGHFLSMDKGTTRKLIGAHLFRIEVDTKDGPQIAEFSPAELDLKQFKKACDLTPKKP